MALEFQEIKRIAWKTIEELLGITLDNGVTGTPSASTFLRGDGTWAAGGGGGSGTVTDVSVVTANGVSGSVATSTTTPAITLTLGAITPTSVSASGTLAGSNFSGTLSGNSSGTNTGDQTIRRTCGVTFDGGGSTPTPGTVGYVVAQFSGTITRWDVVADQSGSAVIDVWKAAGAIPTDADRIAGTEKPTLAAAQLGSDTSLGTWTTAVTAGDVFGFELESVTTCTRLTVEVSINQS